MKIRCEKEKDVVLPPSSPVPLGSMLLVGG